MSCPKKCTLTSKRTAEVGYVVVDMTFLFARRAEFLFRFLGENVVCSVPCDIPDYIVFDVVTHC